MFFSRPQIDLIRIITLLNLPLNLQFFAINLRQIGFLILALIFMKKNGLSREENFA